MRVLITNMANDGNRGDLAILAGTTAAVRDAAPGVHIEIAPTEIGRRENLDGPGMEHSAALADAALIASPVPSRVDDGWSPREWGERTARALLGRHTGTRWLAQDVDERYREAAASADLVIVKGGSYLFSYPGARQALFAARMMHSIRVAREVGTPSVVLGTSLGPVQRPLRGYFTRSLSSCRTVVTREELSYEFATSTLGLRNARRGVDMAFALYQPQGACAQHAGIALTPRELPFVDAGARERYEGALTRTISMLLERTDERCYLTCQVDRDRALCERLLEAVGYPERVEIARVDQLALDQVIKFYGERELLIATRLHSVILAALGHTPSVVLECDPPKMIGISEQLGLADWRLASARSEILDLPQRALDAYEDRESKRSALGELLGALAEQSRRQTAEMLG